MPACCRWLRLPRVCCVPPAGAPPPCRPPAPPWRRLLLRLFPTRVKLAPPPAGPAAARHQQRMQRDVAEEAEEENYRVAAAVAASTGVAIPPKASGIYGGSPGARLSRGDWGKVLSWAVAMQTLQAKQQLLQEEEEQEEEEGEEEEREQAAALLCPAEAAADEAAPSLAGNRGSSRGPRQEAALAPGAGLRQRQLAPSLGAGATAAGEEAEAAAGAAGRADSSRRLRSAPGGASARPTLAASLWQGLWQAVSPLRLAASAAALPWRLAQAASGAARTALYRLPLVGGPLEGLLEGRLDAAQLEAELRELEAQLAQLERHRGAAASSGAASVDGGSGGGGGGGSGALRLSGTAVRYGLGMLQRSSGGVKQRIEPANSYERALLAEVGQRRGAAGGGARSPPALPPALCSRIRSRKRPRARLWASAQRWVGLWGRPPQLSSPPPPRLPLHTHLPQVLSPEDCGRGFNEVGALGEAKAALREAVQLPLQHPHLFTGAHTAGSPCRRWALLAGRGRKGHCGGQGCLRWHLLTHISTARLPAYHLPAPVARRARRRRSCAAVQGRPAVWAPRHRQDAGGSRGGGRVRRRVPGAQPLRRRLQVVWRQREVHPVRPGALIAVGRQTEEQRQAGRGRAAASRKRVLTRRAPRRVVPCRAQRRLHPGRQALPRRHLHRRGGRPAGAPQLTQGARGASGDEERADAAVGRHTGGAGAGGGAGGHQPPL